MEYVEECIFCRIAAGKSPGQLEYQDDQVVVFWDIQPVAPTHLLVVCRKHIPSLAAALPEDEMTLGKMIYVAKEVAKRKGLDLDGYRIVINSGTDSGQLVDHLHIHLLAGANLGPMASSQAPIIDDTDMP